MMYMRIVATGMAIRSSVARPLLCNSQRTSRLLASHGSACHPAHAGHSAHRSVDVKHAPFADETVTADRHRDQQLVDISKIIDFIATILGLETRSNSMDKSTFV
ncbi:MAG: hypothetical protein WA395_15400 [Nitrososphaeraceae archaeon]